jgi:hypothetical protein
MSMKILLAGAVLTTGCYKATSATDINPPKPPVLVDGEQVVATDEVIKRDSYHVNYSGDIVQNKDRVGDATYHGEKLSIPRLQAIADPDKWHKEVSHAQELRENCKKGVVPEYVAEGFGLIASGLAIGLLAESGGASYNDMSSNEKLALYGVAATAAASITSYAIGYVRGGGDCEELKSYREEIHIDDHDDDVNQSGSEIDLINQLAAQFNSAHGGPPVTPTEESSN